MGLNPRGVTGEGGILLADQRVDCVHQLILCLNVVVV